MASTDMAHADSGPTHFNDLPDDVLARVFWPLKQPTSCRSERDDLSNVVSRPKYIRVNATPEEPVYGRRDTPMPTPPRSADAAYTILLASICRRWRRITQRHVSSLFVKEDRVVSHQDVLNAVACLPHLTHLHLSDSSVEILDNAFLTNLAAACPKLRAFHVGRFILTAEDEGGRKPSLITKAGLDKKFRRCPDLEHLSLSCLRKNVRPPASFFQLQNLRTLVLSNPFVLSSSKCNSLVSLTALSIETTYLHYEQLSNLLHLTNLTSLSLPNEIRLISETPPAFSLAELPLLSSLKVGVCYAQFSVFFPLRFPYRSLKRLELTRCDEQESLPDSIGEVMPCLKELRICNCRCLTDLTDQFTSLSCLEKLTVTLCSIISLPIDFGNLPSLKTLVLEFLPLRSLPDSFTRLASLEAFFLLGCVDMDELPPGCGCLTGLRTLHLSSPALDLPDDLGDLTNLQTFRLKKSSEDQLPLSFTQLVSLTRLELDECSIGELPEGFEEMTNLQEIYIQNCPDIQELPESVTDLVRLRVLRIENCSSLSSIPRRLDQLVRLEQLELRGCEHLNGTLQTLPKSLQALFYQNSQLAVPLPDMSVLSKLKDLHLGFVDAAGLFAIGANLSCLERLDMALGADGGVAEEFLFTLASLSRLRELTLMGARINVNSLEKLLESDGLALQELRQLCIYALTDDFTRLPLAITTLQHLTSLQIHAPYLSSLPDELRVFSRLRQLNLSHCSSLAGLPASLTDLSCLTDLNISHTSVRSLPRGLSRLRRLKNLDLDNCKQLEILPDEIQDLPMLDSLSTEGCEADRQMSDILADILFGDDNDFIL